LGRTRCARNTHRRHQPGGKIHLGLVWKSHQTRMMAAKRRRPMV
jgi:hypothetical protein